MTKKIAVSLALLLSVACASTATKSDRANASAAGSSSFVNDGRSYILLSAPEQIRTMDYSTYVRGLHLRGTLTNKGFMPAGKIEGNGQFCADGKDWLDLSTLKVYKAVDGKTPTTPYVLGCANGTSFQPASREVVAQ